MVLYQLPMSLWDATNQRWGDRINKYLGGAEYTLSGIWEKKFTKIEANSGMAERLVRDLAIEEALQEEIKYTMHSYGTLSTSDESLGCN